MKVRRTDRKGKTYTYKRAHPLWEFRDLRDTFGTTMMSHPEIAPREVQEWMGHKSLSTTSERYGGYLPSADAAERMGKAFGDRSPTGPRDARRETAEDDRSVSDRARRVSVLRPIGRSRDQRQRCR